MDPKNAKTRSETPVPGQKPVPRTEFFGSKALRRALTGLVGPASVPLSVPAPKPPSLPEVAKRTAELPEHPVDWRRRKGEKALMIANFLERQLAKAEPMRAAFAESPKTYVVDDAENVASVGRNLLRSYQDVAQLAYSWKHPSGPFSLMDADGREGLDALAEAFRRAAADSLSVADDFLRAPDLEGCRKTVASLRAFASRAILPPPTTLED